MTKRIISQRVRLGMDKLNTYFYDKDKLWKKRIDHESLDICTRCVFVQLFGSFEEGVKVIFPELNAHYRWHISIYYGLYPEERCDSGLWNREGKALTKEWIKQLSEQSEES